MYKPIKCELKFIGKNFSDVVTLSFKEWITLTILLSIFTMILMFVNSIWANASLIIAILIWTGWIYHAHQVCKKR